MSRTQKLSKQSHETLAESWLRHLADDLQPTSYRPVPSWPRIEHFRNRDTGKLYRPHTPDEEAFVRADQPAHVLLKGGWGAGKSAAVIVKALDRVRRGCSGIMVSPDNPHFERSLWMEFERWCPWDHVVYHNQTRRLLRFDTGAFILYGGIEDPEDWEGPNVNWALFDEARKKKDPAAFKVLMSRVRVPGPKSPENPDGVPPQLFIATTPAKNWLFDYFGPLREDDGLASFKKDSKTITLVTKDNLENLDPNYVDKVSSGLTEAEIRVNLLAEWEDLEDTQRFLPAMILWDLLREDMPPLTRNEPMVVSLDAGVSHDNFGLLGVTRHPKRSDDVAVRVSHAWAPGRYGSIDFIGTDEHPGPEKVLRSLCSMYNVVEVCYDRHELHEFVTRLGPRGDGLAWFREFNQGALRMESDKFLLDLVLQRRLAHAGDPTLRQHIDNADRHMDPDTRRLRIVKRNYDAPIDLAVALSMGAYEVLRLNL